MRIFQGRIPEHWCLVSYFADQKRKKWSVNYTPVCDQHKNLLLVNKAATLSFEE